MPLPGSPWAIAEDVLPLIAADLGVAEADLGAAWAGRLVGAIPQARREIETALDARAYTPQQVEQCDWLFDEHCELSLIHAAIKGGTLAGYDLSGLQMRLQRIADRLKKQPVTVGGTVLWPARTEPGGQSVGIAGGTLAGAADAYGDPLEPWRRRIDPNQGY